MTISEVYNLEDDPNTWAATLTEAYRKFFMTNGILPHCLGLHDDFLELFLKALEHQGFKFNRRSIKSEFIEQMAKTEDLAAFTLTKVISPQGDFELLAVLSDEPDLMQFQLAYIDGRKQPTN